MERFNIHDKTYWVVAIKAAIIAGQRTAVAGVRGRRLHNKREMYMTRRARLDILEVEERIGLDRYTYIANNKQ